MRHVHAIHSQWRSFTPDVHLHSLVYAEDIICSTTAYRLGPCLPPDRVVTRIYLRKTRQVDEDDDPGFTCRLAK